MKASDTKYCPQHGYPLPCDKCGMGEYERGKADGIKEVVECVESFIPLVKVGMYGVLWQAKLKDWEVTHG